MKQADKISFIIGCVLGFVIWLTAINWTEPYVYDLKDYVDPSECTVRGCVLDNAFAQVISDCESSLVGSAGNRASTGCKIYVPAGDHTLNQTLEFCRAYSIEGRGGFTNRRPLTKISSPVGFFRGIGFDACKQAGLGYGGVIEIKGLGLYSPPGAHSTPIIAIETEAPIRIENVWISYPDVGLVITGDVNRVPASNANVFRIFDLTTEYTRHYGVIFQGGDANAGAIIAPNINTACMATGTEMTALTAQFGACGGYVDSSFLGNFAVAGHFGIAGGYPDFVIEGASNHGTCLGCYVEGPDSPSLDAQWSQWIGGLGTKPTGSGLRLDGRQASGIFIVNDKDPTNVVTMEMGSAVNQGGVFYNLRHNGNGSAWPLRMKWDMVKGQYLEDIGNVAVGRVRTIEGTKGPNNDVNFLGETTYYDLVIEDTEWCPPEPVCQ